MITHFDHVTLVVRDVGAARDFFALLGFSPDRSVVIHGEPFASYMGIADLEAEHHTLVLAGASPRFEVQLLRLLRPEALPNPDLATLRGRGFNHICLATDDLDGDLARLRAAGVAPRNAVMIFHDRKLVFLDGPEGAVVELAQWRPSAAGAAAPTAPAR
jgi:catechol 2,3-dioxygenase-like lactoylglutathione lyase family enzyme